MPRFASIILVTFYCMTGAAFDARGQIGFAENQADRIRVFNAGFYDIAFRKSDGRVLYVYDKTISQEVSPGNVYGPWVMRFSNDTWLDGANFSPTDPTRLFSYAWDSQLETLTLSYVATGSQACEVTLEIRATNGPELDTTLTVNNQSGMTIELVAHPVHLSFRPNEVNGVYVPYMEGMKLLPSFFDNYEYSSRYPGQMFADFAFTDLTTGSFAVYGIHDLESPLRPATWLILRDNSYAGGVHKYHHDFVLDLASGQQWTSPTMVISVGSTLEEAMASYWTRNGYDAMPKLTDKLSPDLYEKLSKAVLLKRDMLQGSWTFASFESYLPNLPANSLIHLVAFWPNGFDENYPDYLPPHPALGTLAQLQSLVAAARAAGHLVMPYTNPTWWDDQSPTLATLGPGIVAKDRDQNLIYENYGVHGGYVVSPYSPDVIARQDQTRSEFSSTVPCDLLFEDQLGARQQPTFDGNASAPGTLYYGQGLVEIAKRSAQTIPIMTEGGFDRIAWHETGYCNSLRIGWHYWPSSTYTAYPMTPLWAHENLYFSPHNLAGESMSNDLPALSYYVAMGYSLTQNLSTLDADWLHVLDQLQKHFVSTIFGEVMVSFDELTQAGHTRTTFGNSVEVTANLTTTARAIDNHVIAANGFAGIKNGQVQAGVFTELNGQSLSGNNPHYLVFEREPHRTQVYQPRGDDGDITLMRPAVWVDDSRIFLFAVQSPNIQFVRSVTIQPGTLTFDYVGTINSQAIDYFKLIYCTDTDVDCDGDTDVADYGVLVDCVSGPNAMPSPTPPRTAMDCLDAFDQDADSDVDLVDFQAFLAGFTGGS